MPLRPGASENPQRLGIFEDISAILDLEAIRFQALWLEFDQRLGSLRKGQLNRHTRYRPATTTRNTATQRSCHSVD